MRSLMRLLMAGVIAFTVSLGAQAAEKVRVGVLKFGTVNWERLCPLPVGTLPTLP